MRRALAVIGGLFGVLIVVTAPGSAQSPPSVSDVVQKMKQALEPARASTRTLTITVSDMGDTQKFIARQARKQMPDGKRMVTVMMEPEDVRGMAFLVSEPKDPTKSMVMWTYVPFIRRVKKILAIDGFQHFLGTDFTYADLGFVRVHKNYKLLGSEQHGGTLAYKVNEKLPPDQYYYSHIILWVGQSSMLPLQRDYYDPAGDVVWKREVFDSVSTVDGVPTILHAKMTDLIENTSTDLNVTQIKYDTEVPDALLDPSHLPKLVDDPAWQAGTTQ